MRTTPLLIAVLAVLALAFVDASSWGASGRTSQLALIAAAGAALLLSRSEARA